MATPFVLLDDARSEGASPARLYRDPREIVVARRPEEVQPALARIAVLAREGRALAGMLAYEAGLALEPRLAPLAAGRTGAAGPLVWFGAFDGWEEIAADAVPGWLGQAQGSDARIGPLEPQLSPGGYSAAFDTLVDAIRAGDIYQANLTFPLAGSFRGDPLALYAAIRPHAAAGYGGIVFDGGRWLLSFSPELFFALKDGAVTAKPMKGTRPRDADPARDSEVAAELAASVKDRAENLMIVDLMRNDLSRVAEPGSVSVERAFAVESYPTVHQMTTTVRARLRNALDFADLLRAIFPCGSITGAPKIRAMELIGAVERDARGAYCGAIGRIDPPAPGGRGRNGTSDAAFNVAIRTLQLDPASGRARMGIGSAIVADSDCLGEWRECVVKGGFVGRSAAASADLIETMRFDPAQGIALIELHLERMKASAAELGFAFDRHALRNAIQALCFDLDAPARVRVLAGRGGAHAIEAAPLPEPLPEPARVALLPLPVAANDWRLRHKTSDRGFYDEALAVARTAGADEAVFVDDAGRVTEGSFTNVFVERDGKLLTPPSELGLLAGVLRRSLLDAGCATEAELHIADLEQGFLLGNALRGLLPARLLAA